EGPFDPVAPGASRLSAEEGVTLARTHEGRYAINAGDGLRYVFGDRVGLVHRLAALEDRNGNRIGLTYPDAGADVSAGVRGVDETIHVDCSGGQRLALVIRRSRLCEVVELRAAPAATVRLARYAYTANGDLHEVFNRADERMRVFDCDAQHRIRHQVHAGSFESWVEYLGAGAGSKVVRHWDNTGESWTFEYRAIDTRVTDGSGRVSLYHVDARRRWIGYTDPLGRLTRFGLDRQGNVRSVVDPAQNVTETVFDERNRPVEVREADDAVTRIEWHAELDLPVAVVDALGGTQRFEYDARGNLVAEVDACGAETRYQRDERGLAVAITDARGGVATLSHDARGLPLRVTDCSGSETRYVYDDDGWLRGVVDELGRPTTYDYDAAGRLRRETLADGSFTEWESDLADRPLRTTDALGHTHRFRYAPDGLLVEQVDPLGHVLACRYGPGRQLVELVNENGARYRFEYDAADQLVGQSRFDGGVTRYEHDAARRIVRMVEAPGTPEAIVTHYRRDAMGRLLERRTDTRRTVLRYDVAGRIVEAHDGTVGVRIEHDAVGRVVGEAVAAPGWRYALRHAHDPLGNRLSTRLQDGTTIEALHYGSGHVHQIRLDDRPLTDFERDAAHQEVSRTQGRLVTTRRHDAVGRLRRQSTRFAPAAGPRVPDRRAGASVIQRRYRYDLAGRLVLAMDRGRRLTYGHDALDRLTRFCDEHFVFDPAHNLQPAGAARVVPDNLVKTFGPYRYRHDAHGRVVEKRVGDVVIRLAWNDDHRLVESTRHT
ncbi:MAG TPA: hypothetical protein VMR43_17565, partial [Variovorax sp.]|nr:hypothetical protein [Variovorax sp.]